MTQAIAVSLLAVAGFIIALWWTNIAGIAHKIVGASMAGVAALFDNQLSDDAKEAAARRAGVQLILGGLNLTWRIALALAAAGPPSPRGFPPSWGLRDRQLSLTANAPALLGLPSGVVHSH